jgi:PAS domain S-box-containing protein
LAKSAKGTTKRVLDRIVRPKRRSAAPTTGLSVVPPGVIEGQLAARPPANQNDEPVRQEILRHIKTLDLDPSVPLYVATVGGVLIHVNEAYRALAKLNDSARLPSLTSNAAADLPEAVKGLLALVQLSDRDVRIEEKLVVEGVIRYFRSIHVAVKDAEGTTVAVAGTYFDVTAERAELQAAATAENQLRDFARAATDWFWETDAQNKVTTLSDRLTDILGAPKALLIGQNLSMIGTFPEPKPGERSIFEAIAGHVPFRDCLLEMKTDSGEVRQFHLSGVPAFENGSGQFKGYRGAGMDMTLRYRAEREATAARSELEAMLETLTNKNIELDVASQQARVALDAKNEFLAAMSHELRTPLNAVIGFAEAMKLRVFGELNTQYAGYAEDIVSAGRHLLALINDVLDASMIDSGKLSLLIEPLDLSEIVKRALNLVIVRATKKSVDIEGVRVAEGVVIRADVVRSTQILVNLLSNAVKFTPGGGKVGVDVDTSKPDRIAVTVWDTGIGIDQSKHEAVFEKFRRIDEDVFTRREEGTGLGLHISRELARGMAGDLTFTSAPGEGSRFTVTFPKA